MTFGVVLSFYNFQHFRQKVNIINEFIPQIIFLEVIFFFFFFFSEKSLNKIKIKNN